MMSMPSLTLVPGVCERCMIKRHLPDFFLGTAPSGLSGLMTKAGRGGAGNGPAVWPAWHSFWR